MSPAVQIDGSLLEVGDPAGTIITQPGPAGEGIRPLVQALEADGRDPARERRAAETLEDFTDSASEVTAKVERAESLFKTLAAGEFLDPERLGAEIGTMLDLLERLDRRGRWEDELRLARALAALLALTMRWAALIRSAGLAVEAATHLDDLGAIAWAKHELGTLRLVSNDLVGADRDLTEARELRQRLGDRSGLNATNHNLGVLCQHLRQLLREGRIVQRRGLRRTRILLATAAAVLLLAGGIAAAVIGGGGGGGGDGGRADEIGRVGTTGIEGVQEEGGGGAAGGGAAGGGLGEAETSGTQTGGPEEPQRVKLIVEMAGDGPGRVRAPDAIDCGQLLEGGEDCEEEFDPGAVIELTAVREPDSSFGGWSGDVDCSDKRFTCVLTMDRSRTVTATFDLIVIE